MRPILVAFILACFQFSWAQNAPLGNEWIVRYDLPHYKIKVTQDGFYRINQSTLAQAISNLNNINGNQFRLYNKGKSIPLYVSSTGTLSSTDYIEFYGKANDGEFDQYLYDTITNQPHQYYSLFDDTATYFLYYDNTPNGDIITDVPNDITGLSNPEQYYWQTNTTLLTENHSVGVVYGSDRFFLSSPVFERGEGFSSNPFTDSRSFSVPVQELENVNGLNATVNLSFFSERQGAFSTAVSLNNRSKAGFTNTEHQPLRHVSFSVPLSELENVNTIEVRATSGGNDWTYVYHGEITYPHNFEFEFKSVFPFNLDLLPNQRKLVEVRNFNAGGQTPVLYDLTNKRRLQAHEAPGKWVFGIPSASTGNAELVIRNNTSGAGYNIVNDLEPITFTNFFLESNQSDFIIISHPKFAENGASNNALAQYKNYRDGRINPNSKFDKAEVYFINQLYDQFAYGIQQHSLAIRNFLQFANENWNTTPTHAFLIGKGREYVQESGPEGLTSIRNSSAGKAVSYIPTFGTKGGDNLFGIKQGELDPFIAIGRLAVDEPIQIRNYLRKVQTYEANQLRIGDPFQTIADKAWMKSFMHFGGGTSISEQDRFKNYLQNYERIVTDGSTNYGGEVTAYYKESSEPITNIQSELLHERLNKGVSMMTYFGHSSASGAFDISLDDPENYTNFGKYPLVNSMGCFAGNVHTSSPSISEQFVFVEDKGAIAFLATTDLSSGSGLNVFARRMYLHLSELSYGESIGNIVKNTAADVIVENYGNSLIPHIITLHGDPGIELNNFDQPDLVIEPQNVSFDPAVIDASLDSFEVVIQLTNIGKATQDTVEILIERIGSNGISESYNKLVPLPAFQEEVRIKIASTIEDEVAFGLNTFNIYLDPSDSIANELSETNNNLINVKSVQIISDDVIPVYPYDYALLHDENITLNSSTVDPFAPERTYLIEIDTNQNFNSNFKQTTSVTQSGGVVSWKPNINWSNDQVYYWRVATDRAELNWHEQSFIFKPSSTENGFNQSHVQQYAENEYSNIELTPSGGFKFVDDFKEIRVQAGQGYATNLRGWYLNGVDQHHWRMNECFDGVSYKSGFTVAVINDRTGLPWKSVNLPEERRHPSINHQYGNVHCHGIHNPQLAFNFRLSGNNPDSEFGSWANTFTRFINSIPDGYYVLIYTLSGHGGNNVNFAQVDQSIIDAVVALGGSEITKLKNQAIPNGSYTFFSRKGDSNFEAIETVAPNYSEQHSMETSIVGQWREGSMTTPIIGPSQRWVSLSFDFSSLNNVPDELNIDVFGVTQSGQRGLLFNTENDTTLSTIDASIYPYLQLVFNATDETDRTPPQINFWRIFFEPFPELALNPNALFEVTPAVNQGEEITLKVALDNLTPIPFDSVLVQYQISDANNNLSIVEQRSDLLDGFGRTILTLSPNSLDPNFIGTNSVLVDANFDNEQPELHHFNNVGVFNFEVNADHLAPILDVTFDQQYIIDGATVRNTPVIEMELFDDNDFLFLDDTSAFEIAIKYPDGTLVPFYFTNSILSFEPATDSNDYTAKATLLPTFTVDGLYELHVNGIDKSGNKTSQLGYRSTFRIDQNAAISNMVNYPNPFSDETQFYFNLTGNEVPETITMQIYSRDGALVQVLHKDDFGTIQIGANKTTFSWAGTDSNGAPLPSGVYLYTVVAKHQGKTLNHIESAVDAEFKAGFGRMIIAR